MGGAFVLKTEDNPDFQIVAIASYPLHGILLLQLWFFSQKS